MIHQNIEVHMLPLDGVSPSAANPRKFFDPSALEELAASIAEQGMIHPIVVRRITDWSQEGCYAVKHDLEGDEMLRLKCESPEEALAEIGKRTQYEIVSGERRWRAAKSLGWTTLPCSVVDIDEPAAMEARLAENIQRGDLSPLEEAEAFRAWMDLPVPEAPAAPRGRGQPKKARSQQALADKIGKSQPYVTKRLAMLRAPKDVLDLVGRGEVPPTWAEEIGAIPSEEDRLEVARKVVASDYIADLDGLKSFIAETCMMPLARAGWPLDDAGLVPETQRPDGGRRGGACEGCPNVTEAVEGRMCALPACFRAKASEWYAREKRRHVGEVLTKADAEKVFGHDGVMLKWNAPYVDERAVPTYQDGLVMGEATKKTWSQLLKGTEAPRVLAQDATGVARFLIRRDMAVQAAKAAGHGKLFGDGHDEAEGADERKEQKKAEERAMKRQRAQVVATHLAGLAAVRSAAQPQWDPEAWRAAAKVALSCLNEHGGLMAARVLVGDDVKREDAFDRLEQLLDGYTASTDLRAALAVILASVDLWTDLGPNWQTMASGLGVQKLASDFAAEARRAVDKQAKKEGEDE